MKKYFSFYGHARRKEYWVVFCIVFIAEFYNRLLLGDIASAGSVIIKIPLIWLACTLTVRRLRDAGISLWFIILFFIPAINVVSFIIIGYIKSDNEYILTTENISEDSTNTETHSENKNEKEKSHSFFSLERLKRIFAFFSVEKLERNFPFLGFLLLAVCWAFSMFLIFNGLLGIYDMLTNLVVWKLIVYLPVALNTTSESFIFTPIGATYWLVTELNWSIGFAIVFAFCIAFVAWAIIFGQGVIGMFQWVKNLYQSRR